LPAPQPEADLSRQARVFVREFRLDGNTVFTDEELAGITRAYTNREITTGELQELRYQLTPANSSRSSILILPLYVRMNESLTLPKC
jgi:hemolysin activation/secretion protein